MSDFDDASLVLIPSGYKNGKVYSVKPTDGTGDLTFTRASSATRVASNGLIEKVRTNLVLQSETFQTSWTAQTATITANATTAPDGTLTADKLVAAVGTGLAVQHRIDQTTTSAVGVNTFSVYGKKSELDIIQLRIGTNGAGFNLTTGTVGGLSSGVTASISNAGNGWFRCVITFTSIAANEIVRINLATALLVPDSFIGNGTDGAFIWGAQLETGDIATDYIPTTTAAVSVGPVSGLPRLDYLNSTCPKLLLEPQRTNMFLNADWTGSAPATSWTLANNNGTITKVISTLGVGSNALSFANTGGGSLNIEQSITFTASTHTISFYIESITGALKYEELVRLTGSPNITAFAFFLNGASVLASAQIQAGRVEYRFTLGTAALHGVRIGSGTAATVPAANTLILSRPQCELAASYATSYIPTLSASVTRVADAASKTGISSLIGQTEGTVFVEFNNRLLASYPNEYIVQIISGTTQLWLRKEQGGASFTARLIVSGSTIWTFASSIVPINGNNKIAIAYKTGDSAVFLNGAQVSSTNTSAFSGSAFADLNFNWGGTLNPELPLSQALLFKTRLTNAQLAELTTL